MIIVCDYNLMNRIVSFDTIGGEETSGGKDGDFISPGSRGGNVSCCHCGRTDTAADKFQGRTDDKCADG